MRCPTCGGNLSIEDENAVIECVYCGNLIKPVSATTTYPEGGSPQTLGGNVLKIDGIKTSSSARAYFELFCEEYDWESFAYGDGFAVAELEQIADTLKTTSADNKETWLFCYQAATEPFRQKYAQCKKLLSEIIDQYRNDDPDAYSSFDVYVRLSKELKNNYAEVYGKAHRFLNLAEKNGASSEETDTLLSGEVTESEVQDLPVFKYIMDIEEVRAFEQEKQEKIKSELEARGIDPEKLYQEAASDAKSKDSVSALKKYRLLGSYKDSEKLAAEQNRFFEIDGNIVVVGNLFHAVDNTEEKTRTLYEVRDGKVLDKPVIKNISKIIANYGERLYYLDKNQTLYTFFTGKREILKVGGSYSVKDILISPDRNNAYLFSLDEKKLVRLDLETGTTTKIADGDGTVLNKEYPYIALYNNKLTTIIDLRNGDRTDIVKGKVEIEGYLGNQVIYSVLSPDKDNRDLFIRELSEKAKTILLEKNIYRYINVFNDVVYYSVGGSSSQALISIHPDGTDRREVFLRTDNVVVFGEWLYFIRAIGRNRVLFRSHQDGSDLKVICSDILKLIERKSGYLFYLDTYNTLNRIRMNGSMKQSICSNVKHVLSIRDDAIIYTSLDGSGEGLYVADLNGKERRKLAHRISDVMIGSQDSIYYVTDTRNENRKLYSLSCDNYSSKKMLEYINAAPEKKGCYIATCVYGSYDCPEVWVLRRYRDYTLAETRLGRLFIRLYYMISPTLVGLFGEQTWFRNSWKALLDRFVGKLSERGIDNSPYKDNIW